MIDRLTTWATWEIVWTGGLPHLSWSDLTYLGAPPPCRQPLSVYLPSKTAIQIKKLNFHSYFESDKREKRSKREPLHLTAMRRDIMGIDKFCGIANRSVTGASKNNCVSLHQIILGSMNKQSWNWISLVISQLKTSTFLRISFCE